MKISIKILAFFLFTFLSQNTYAQVEPSSECSVDFYWQQVSCQTGTYGENTMTIQFTTLLNNASILSWDFGTTHYNIVSTFGASYVVEFDTLAIFIETNQSGMQCLDVCINTTTQCDRGTVTTCHDVCYLVC